MSPASSAEAGGAGAAPVFAALGDETRLALVSRLCAGGPLSIARLSAGSTVTRQAITKHLHVLASAGLVRGTRRGRERVWQLEPRRLQDARQYLDLVSHSWDQALARLAAFVER
jgi:DNA-binding transcriptional ArsR family regulator